MEDIIIIIIILERIAAINAQSASIVKTYLCSAVDHYASTYGDRGWGCRYRNMQMLLSSLLRSPVYAPLLAGAAGGGGGVPSVPALQVMVERAWQRGFDVQMDAVSDGCNSTGEVFSAYQNGGPDACLSEENECLVYMLRSPVAGAPEEHNTQVQEAGGPAPRPVGAAAAPATPTPLLPPPSRSRKRRRVPEAMVLGVAAAGAGPAAHQSARAVAARIAAARAARPAVARARARARATAAAGARLAPVPDHRVLLGSIQGLKFCRSSW
ncbi:unnamed protein product [Plutella xylostella]|uniref:(diamondback moth) hypothetical protein n=1 Tax=Plutella xylostella TaxID=51655 RepID=A0A8S4FUU1_PLUXY|nr:unnamed protein product [Plutella xylostella]